MKYQENNFEYFSIEKLGFYKTTLKDLNVDYWINLIYEYKNLYPQTVYNSNQGGYQSSPNLNTYSPFIPLCRIAQECLYNLFPNQFNSVKELWINISPYGCYNHIHTHTKGYSSEYSGIIYLKTPKNSGELEFHNPLNLNGSYNILPEPKDIILFPSYLPHSVRPNQNQEDRISIAFNFS